MSGNKQTFWEYVSTCVSSVVICTCHVTIMYCDVHKNLA